MAGPRYTRRCRTCARPSRSLGRAARRRSRESSEAWQECGGRLDADAKVALFAERLHREQQEVGEVGAQRILCDLERRVGAVREDDMRAADRLRISSDG